jgi:hypothetical protein
LRQLLFVVHARALSPRRWRESAMVAERVPLSRIERHTPPQSLRPADAGGGRFDEWFRLNESVGSRSQGHCGQSRPRFSFPRVAGLWASRQQRAIRHECRSLRALEPWRPGLAAEKPRSGMKSSSTSTLLGRVSPSRKARFALARRLDRTRPRPCSTVSSRAPRVRCVRLALAGAVRVGGEI